MLSTNEIRQHIRLLPVAGGLFPFRKGSIFKIYEVTSLCRLAEQLVFLANLFLCHLLCLLQRALVAERDLNRVVPQVSHLALRSTFTQWSALQFAKPRSTLSPRPCRLAQSA